MSEPPGGPAAAGAPAGSGSSRPASVPVDDLGTAVPVPAAVSRVVSLVPSLTESVAATVPGLLVGATDYCTHPAGLDVARVGGSKYPDLDRVLALEPDLVLANAEENQLSDVAALRAAGIPVWVTAPTTLAGAFTSLRRMLAVCGVEGTPVWLDEARRAWSSTYDGSPADRTAAVPIWRRPWRMGGAGALGVDLVRRLGVAKKYGKAAERYAFSAADGPEEFAGLDVALVSGRHLTWYGPSLLEARDLLERQLAEVLRPNG